ncbi:unnamed protein product, partial [Rotaria magnacalcarata]
MPRNQNAKNAKAGSVMVVIESAIPSQ